MIGRLVQQADCSVLRDECRDVEPAPFASGKRIDGSLGQFFEPDGGERSASAGEVARVFPLPEWQVGMAADQRGLENRGGKRVFSQLRQERNAARALPSRPFREIAPVEQHLASRCRAKSGESVKRERLADAISPQHRDELAAAGIEVERTYERSSRNFDVDRAAFEPRTVVDHGCRRS